MTEPLPRTPTPGGGAPQNGMGVAALVLGIVAFFCLPLIGGILAVVFGKIGMSRADQGLATNRGIAKAGFILGIVHLALCAFYVLSVIVIWIAAGVQSALPPTA